MPTVIVPWGQPPPPGGIAIPKAVTQYGRGFSLTAAQYTAWQATQASAGASVVAPQQAPERKLPTPPPGGFGAIPTPIEFTGTANRVRARLLLTESSPVVLDGQTLTLGAARAEIARRAAAYRATPPRPYFAPGVRDPAGGTRTPFAYALQVPDRSLFVDLAGVPYSGPIGAAGSQRLDAFDGEHLRADKFADFIKRALRVRAESDREREVYAAGQGVGTAATAAKITAGVGATEALAAQTAAVQAAVVQAFAVLAPVLAAFGLAATKAISGGKVYHYPVEAIEAQSKAQAGLPLTTREQLVLGTIRARGLVIAPATPASGRGALRLRPDPALAGGGPRSLPTPLGIFKHTAVGPRQQAIAIAGARVRTLREFQTLQQQAALAEFGTLRRRLR